MYKHPDSSRFVSVFKFSFTATQACYIWNNVKTPSQEAPEQNGEPINNNNTHMAIYSAVALRDPWKQVPPE